MDIHKPKAARSWREFLIEIGTIICGILIALGLEQSVELVHRSREVAEARQALGAEIAYNLAGVDFTASQMDCARRRLAELSRWRASLSERRPLLFAQPVVPPLRLPPHTSVWKVASVGAVAHMPFESRVAYGEAYDRIELVEAQAKIINDLWTELSKLSMARTLDDAQRLDFDYDIQRLSRSYSVLGNNLNLVRRDARGLGITKGATIDYQDLLRPTQASKVAFCMPALAATS